MTPAFVSDPVLEELKHRLASLDRSLVLTLGAREQVQWEILEYRRARSLPLYDGRAEQTVRRRVHTWAHDDGADPDLAERVVGAATRSGRRRFGSKPARTADGGGSVVVLLQPPDLAASAVPVRTQSLVAAVAGGAR